MCIVYSVHNKCIATIRLLTKPLQNSLVNTDYTMYKTGNTNKGEVLSMINPNTGEKFKTNKILTDITYFNTFDGAITYFYRYHLKTNGTYFRYYDNGILEYKTNYKNGKLEGKQYSWYTNGYKKYVLNYIDGKKHEKQEGWYDNGNKMYIDIYSDGKPNRRRYWNRDGSVVYDKF